jgi:hypothetical protein
VRNQLPGAEGGDLFEVTFKKDLTKEELRDLEVFLREKTVAKFPFEMKKGTTVSLTRKRIILLILQNQLSEDPFKEVILD